jgi:hypothetical protein
MHIVIPFAAPMGASIQQALDQVPAPALKALLKRLDTSTVLPGDPQNLTPLHERVQAGAIWPGLALVDGLIPWAAAQAQHPPTAVTTQTFPRAWALLTLCHWVIHADHVEMAEPAQLKVTPDESRTLQNAMRAYFAEDGISLHSADSGTWLAEGAVFKDLPTASLDRVRGSRVDGWIPRQPQAKPLRRLQNEMQMLLYTHPVNDARASQGLPAINAFWVSGTGELPINGGPHTTSRPSAPVLQIHDDLRAAALRDDAAAWRQAWRTLDEGPITQLLQLSAQREFTAHQPIALTLCGEHFARSFALQPRSLWTHLARQFAAPQLPRLLRSL